jgi:hypothetical protein
MRNSRAIAKALLKNLIVPSVLYFCFRFLGDFSSQQSAVLAVVAWIGYGLHKKLNASRTTVNLFSPFSVSIYPNWYELLSDFKLISAEDEWQKLCKAANEMPEPENTVFRRGFTFTVIKPPVDEGLLPGLTFWDNRKVFLVEVELSEPVIEIENEFSLRGRGQEHPFFHHPKWSSLPRFCFKWGTGGYEIGLEVQDDWWEHLRESNKAIGNLAKIKGARDHLCGTTRLVIATLPYSEFSLYYQNVDHDDLKKVQEAMDKQLESNGWKRQVERDSEIRDPWAHVEHKYFTVSHRSI